MEVFNLPAKSPRNILALGAESAGNFSFFENKKIYFSENFGDLTEEKNWKNFQKEVLNFLKKNDFQPKIILSDLHPDFKTTLWGEKLAKKFGASHIQVQHHLAHTFSSLGDKMINGQKKLAKETIYSIVMDGTGLGTDEKIWGGEVFKIDLKNKKNERIGHLENQLLLGGELAIQEPVRMLLGILKKCHSELVSESQKKIVYDYVKKYYSQKEFELLWNQLEQKFNCPETSSAGRVLDATSVLLGFCQNERNFKHEPTLLLEKKSTIPFSDLKPEITKDYVLKTTSVINYVINYLPKRDKKRLAATVQNYIAEGLYEIIKINRHSRLFSESKKKILNQVQDDIYASGGLSTNKIISSYLESKKVYLNKKIPAGDAGISLGQIIYFLLTYSWD